MKYDDQTKEFCLKQIDLFEPNFKKTNILDPLKAAIEEPVQQNFNKRIFLLTDGKDN